MGAKSFPYSRRRVLSAVAGATGLAGCSLTSTEKRTLSSIRISSIEVETKDDRQHVVDILLQRGTDLLFWDEIRVPATGERELDIECVEDPSWQQPGQYFVRARLDERSSWIELDTIAQARQHPYDENDYMSPVVFIPDSGDCYFGHRHGENVCNS